MIEQRAVGGCLGVVELVNDDHVERCRVQLAQPLGVQRLDRGEDVRPAARLLAAHQQFAERGV